MKRLRRKIRIKKRWDIIKQQRLNKIGAYNKIQEFLARSKENISPRVQVWLNWTKATREEKDKMRKEGKAPWQ